MKPDAQPYNVLIAEDNPADVNLLKMAVQDYGKLPWCIHSIDTGESALAFLNGTKPHLIILDVNLPGLSGWEVLETLRRSHDFMTLPVAMLTGVMTLKDKEQEETLKPAACFRKPMNLEEYSRLVQELEALIEHL